MRETRSFKGAQEKSHDKNSTKAKKQGKTSFQYANNANKNLIYYILHMKKPIPNL